MTSKGLTVNERRVYLLGAWWIDIISPHGLAIETIAFKGMPPVGMWRKYWGWSSMPLPEFEAGDVPA